jgi:hypothetical protein
MKMQKNIIMLIAGIALVSAYVGADLVELSHGKRVRDTGPFDGLGDLLANGTWAGDDVANNLSRSVSVFKLPALKYGETVSAATFSATLAARTSKGSNLPGLDVVFYQKGNQHLVVMNDYQAAAAEMKQSIAVRGTPVGTVLEWSDALLLNAIKDAYTNGSAYVAFRFQLAEEGDFWGGSYAISDGDSGQDTYGLSAISLDLTVVTEAVSVGLFILSGL